MDKENKSFNEVLLNAKKLGYAESNPSSDLNGEDVASKLKILSSLCFNSFLNKNIHVEGIKDVNREDIINANKLVIGQSAISKIQEVYASWVNYSIVV